MTNIEIKDAKVGDRLPDSIPSAYGRFINRVISEIRTTKGGRYMLTITSTYEGKDGSLTPQILKFSNGALKGNYCITIL